MREMEAFSYTNDCNIQFAGRMDGASVGCCWGSEEGNVASGLGTPGVKGRKKGKGIRNEPGRR